jgi:negative regulator of flagellin synthesis FlgM
MKISGNDELAKYINEMATKQSRELADKAPTPTDASSGPKEDTVVKLSKRAKEVQAARKAIESEPDIRLEKTQEIADKIKDGTYEVNHEKTAEKMVRAFFDEMV